MADESTKASAAGAPGPSVDRLQDLVTLLRADLEARQKQSAATGRLMRILVGFNVAALVLTLALFGYGLRGNADRGTFMAGKSQGRIYIPPQPKTPIQSADRLVVGKSDDTNNFRVTVEGIQYLKDETRIWVSVDNQSGSEVQFMAGAKAVLLDQSGNVYPVNPFKGDHPFWGPVPAGGKAAGWLSFPPIPEGTKKLTFEVDNVFSMERQPWNVEITFPVQS